MSLFFLLVAVATSVIPTVLEKTTPESCLRSNDYCSLAIWGAGSLSQRFMRESWFSREGLVAILDCDNKKGGLNFMGHWIQTPEEGLSALPKEMIVCCAAAIAGEEIAMDCHCLKLHHQFVNVIGHDEGDS